MPSSRPVNCIISHYDDVTMGAIASQITSLTIVYSTVYSGADQSKHQSSASLVFVWGIHRGPVNSPHKWPVTRKMFPFDDVIMLYQSDTGRFIQPTSECQYGNFMAYVLRFCRCRYLSAIEQNRWWIVGNALRLLELMRHSAIER